jgi:hypothetical protein
VLEYRLALGTKRFPEPKKLPFSMILFKLNANTASTASPGFLRWADF